MYVLNLPRSDDEKEKNLDGMLKVVEENDQVPNADKEKLRELCRKDVDKKAWFDQLTRANIWDCFVEIFQTGLDIYVG
jgi:hypothetical protein